MAQTRIARFLETGLIALVAGASSCVLTIFLSPGRPAATTPIVMDGSAEVESVADALERLETRIAQLSDEVANSPRKSAANPRAKTRGRLAKSGADASRLSEREAWTRTVDGRIARCLTEYAKTPYDQGVAALLRKASRELDAAEVSYAASRRELREQNKQRLAEAQRKKLNAYYPRKEDQQAIETAHKVRVDDALARFRKALARLPSSPRD